MSADTIEIQGLYYSYPGGTDALNGIDLSIKLGRKTAILGANGCGKSTLLQHLNGLLLPKRGTIEIAGRPLSKKTADIIRQDVGLLFDNPDNQLFSPSVESDVEFGPYNLHLPKDEVKKRAQEAMELCSVTEFRERPPYNLSLGQKKRCAIAGVIAMKPRIMLMDEPFSGLDPLSLSSFLDTLDRLHSEGMTQILSTHDVDIAYEWAEDIVVMSGGKVLRTGGRELLQDEELLREAKLTLPIVVKLFSGTDYIPASVEEGRKAIAALLENKKKTGGEN